MWKPPARGRLVQTTWALRPWTATLTGYGRSSTRMPREMRMNVRHFAAAASLRRSQWSAVGATGASGGKAADTLTVWLQVDAQSGWPEVVAAANAQFKAQNPGWDVDVQYQTWGTHLAKFDATLAGEQRAGRHRDGEHRDDEVHGRGRVPGSLGDLVPEQEHLARRARRVRALRRQDLRRPVLRRLARRHVPHGSLPAG